MSTEINKEAYTSLIEEDVAYLNKHLLDSLETDHIKLVLFKSIELLYPEPSLSSPVPASSVEEAAREILEQYCGPIELPFNERIEVYYPALINAMCEYASLQSSQPKGAVWVKASDGKVRDSSFLKLDGEKVNGYFAINGNFIFTKDGEDVTITPDQFHRIEWLDESTPPHGDEGVGIKVIRCDSKVVLENSKGDTYTSKSEELIDFIKSHNL